MLKTRESMNRDSAVELVIPVEDNDSKSLSVLLSQYNSRSNMKYNYSNILSHRTELC